MIISIHDPEPPIEPDEPPVFCYCDNCGGEIYVGERYYKANGNAICHWCFDDLKANELVAGADD